MPNNGYKCHKFSENSFTQEKICLLDIWMFCWIQTANLHTAPIAPSKCNRAMLQSNQDRHQALATEHHHKAKQTTKRNTFTTKVVMMRMIEGQSCLGLDQSAKGWIKLWGSTM